MHLNLSLIASYATRALAAVVTGVPAVEAFQQNIHTGSGADKKATVLELLKTELAAAEVATGRDLVNDGDVLAAGGAVIDAVAAFHKIVGHKAIAPTS
jgi:hypothetical protein